MTAALPKVLLHINFVANNELYKDNARLECSTTLKGVLDLTELKR